MRKVHRKGKITECKGFLKIHVAVDVETKEVGVNPFLVPPVKQVPPLIYIVSQTRLAAGSREPSVSVFCRRLFL